MRKRLVLAGAAVVVVAGVGYLYWGQQDYQKKRQVVFALHWMVATRIHVEESLMKGEPAPRPPPWRPEPAVRTLEVERDGRIVLTFVDDFLPGGRLVMTPGTRSGAAMTWACRAENVPARYLENHLPHGCLA